MEVNRMTDITEETMKKKLLFSTVAILIMFLLLLVGYKAKSYIPKIITYIPFERIQAEKWTEDFHVVNIKSTKDSSVQKTYVFQSTAKTPQPLVVSLHQWSSDYQEYDKIANKVKEKNWNYVHPDFRGSNKNVEACGSDLAIQDIDDAIDFALSNFNCDKDKIYVIGVSGGGHAALASFMKSKHNIAEFSVWCPISDIYWWYHQTKIRHLNYWKDILICTNSLNGQLNEIYAKSKSPIYWETPTQKLTTAKLKIYAGVYDGIQGSVPITQSINFYNKILADINCSDSTQYVNNGEIVHLLEKQTPLKNYGQIGNRKIIFKKDYKNVDITIFDGAHELLPDIVLQTLNK